MINKILKFAYALVDKYMSRYSLRNTAARRLRRQQRGRDILTLTMQNKPQDDEIDGVCVMCLDVYANTIMEPCSHIILCEDCARKIINSSFRTQCVLCRQEVSQIEFLLSDFVYTVVEPKKEAPKYYSSSESESSNSSDDESYM